MSTLVIHPIIHLNGTSKEALLDLRENACGKLSDAMFALAQMAPNGRDYYPQPGLMELAQRQHLRRMKAIQDVQEEIQREVDAIYFVEPTP